MSKLGTLAALLLGLVFFAGVALAADRKDVLLQRLREAERGPATVAAAKALEAVLPDGEDRWNYVRITLEILRQRGEPGAAADLLRRSKGRVGKSAEFQLRERLIDSLIAAGRLDQAQTEAEGALEVAAKEPNAMLRAANESMVHGHLGRVHEAAEHWRAAIAEYEKWDFVASCGVGAFEHEAARRLAVARCRIGLGEADAALATMHELSTSGLDGGLGFDTAATIATYGRCAARVGRDSAARRSAESVPAKQREAWRRIFDVGVAAQAGDAARVVALLDEGRAADTIPASGAHARTSVPVAAIAELKRLGATVAPAVGAAIAAGNRTITLLGLEHHLPGAQEGVAERVVVETNDDWRVFLREVVVETD